jgi:hypothetical protein
MRPTALFAVAFSRVGDSPERVDNLLIPSVVGFVTRERKKLGISLMQARLAANETVNVKSTVRRPETQDMAIPFGWPLSRTCYDDRKQRTTRDQSEEGIMRGIVVLALGLSMAVTEDKPVSPAEQYNAILKESSEAGQANWKARTDEEKRQAAARVEPLPLKLLELAEKNPNEPWTLDALTHVITMEYWLDNYSSHPGWGKDSRQARAIAILLRDHVRSDKLGETCKRVHFGFRKECETFLRTVLEKNPHRDVQGQACLYLAQFLNGRLNRLDLLTYQPNVSRRYEGLYGQDYLDTLRRKDRAKAVGEVEAVFEQAAEKYGDVKLPFGGTVGDNAKIELFAIRHLAVGKEAADIEGPDQDGVRFKLSDYRGKVVLLYFWQHV